MPFSDYPLLASFEKHGIVGRGGAGFPTHLKWQRLKELGKPIGYVICNASEGELNVKKDAYILEHYPEMVIEGMLVAMDFLDVKEAYFNINERYFEQFGQKLKQLSDSISKEKNYSFTYFIEHPSYIGGESSALLEAIEGKATQPRLSPPSPSIVGIFGKPVLVNNVETFYDIARLQRGEFLPTRFMTFVGPIPSPGVYELNRDITVTQALTETGNVPNFDYFVQVGGTASGVVISSDQATTHEVTGCGTIEIYGTDANPYDVLLRWFEFYANESCGKCTPCREGAFYLYHVLKNHPKDEPIPWAKILPIIQTMKQSSFCDLGKSLPIPVESYMKNILKINF